MTSRGVEATTAGPVVIRIFFSVLNPNIGVLGILERNKNKTKNDCQGTDSTFTRTRLE